MMLAVWIGLLLFAMVCGCALILTARAQQSIRASKHISMSAYGSYAQSQQDKHDLNLFGLAQQLRRRLGAAASFGLSFQSLGLIGAVFLLAGPALQKGGPSVVSIGLPILALFGILVSASLAEMSSAVPTAGGVYHWASALGTRRWGWYAGWFHLAGHLAMMALMNGACAFIIDKLLSVWLGYTSSWLTSGVALCMVTAAQAAVHHWGTGKTGALQEAGIFLQAVILAAIIGGIYITFGRSVYSPELLYTFQNISLEGHVTPWAFIAGVIVLQKLFLGMDGAAQASEETSDPRIRVPWAIYFSSVYTMIGGFVLLMCLTLVLPAIVGTNLFSAGDSLLAAAALDGWQGNSIILLMIAAAIWGSGNSEMLICSRAVFCLARDQALPFSKVLSQVTRERQSPLAAILITAVISVILFGAARLVDGGEAGISSLLGFGVLCLQLAYAIPIWIKLKLRGRHRLLADAPWHLGSYRTFVDRAAFVWLLLSGALSIFALGMWGAAGTAIFLILIMVLDRKYRKQHLARLQSRLKRPRGEIIRIERKFNLH
ncbi:amino acid permease [Paenibacillus glycanilyticus]|uniref:amino acid permease n=1 Tax=Paenibacillus glycanilyticus TaxID=126569 RepID=UPI00203E24B4|nr:amino acid permease [Paenibacillus glycanilyticus]MCM3629937.1 amino acid permease [Paenibacillus glycanilyticus]